MFAEGILLWSCDRLFTTQRRCTILVFSVRENKNPSAQYSLTELHQPVKQQLSRFVQRGNRSELFHSVSVCLIGLDRVMLLTTRVCFQQYLTSSFVFTPASYHKIPCSVIRPGWLQGDWQPFTLQWQPRSLGDCGNFLNCRPLGLPQPNLCEIILPSSPASSDVYQLEQNKNKSYGKFFIPQS